MNAITRTAAPYATAQTTSSSSTSTTDSNTITASDFMTLLVTQMKNQDPTAPTDPSAYMQQLVGVNSLQQLIGINEKLSSLAGTTSTTSTEQA